jgi:hypothetical protein
MAEKKRSVDRRKFLAGVLTGGGAIAALAATPPGAGASRPGAPSGKAPAGQPVLYRRTEDVERYYRTLYR